MTLNPAKGQPLEMQATAINVIGWVDDPDTYPIQPKPHSLEFLREVAHLRPRHERNWGGDKGASHVGASHTSVL